MHEQFTSILRRRNGAVLVYVAIVMVAMMAFTSLAVDLGRYETAHTKLYNAAISAARAGAASIPYGASATSAAAIAGAVSNKVDGQQITASMVTVTFLKWTSKSVNVVESTANFAQANAVRVSITYAVPLLFAKIIGYANKSASEYSTCELIMESVSPYVNATGDPWLAGEPTGTQGSQADPNYVSLGANPEHYYPFDLAGPAGTSAPSYRNNGKTIAAQPYASPIQVGFTVTPGATIVVTNVSGSSSHDIDVAPFIDATGNSGTSGNYDDAAANNVSEHGIADATMPIGSTNAVFLDNTLPDSSAAPAALNFGSQAQRDYASISPLLKQPFYIGTGQTSFSQQQTIVVPAKATRMFLGVMDGWEWDNNLGGFNVTVTQVQLFTVE